MKTNFTAKDLLGKEFVIAKPLFKSQRYIIYDIQRNNCFVREPLDVNIKGVSHVLGFFSLGSVSKNFNNGEWILVASKEQVIWLKRLFGRNDLKISETILLKAILEIRAVPYYTLIEREQLNGIRDKYK